MKHGFQELDFHNLAHIPEMLNLELCEDIIFFTIWS